MPPCRSGRSGPLERADEHGEQVDIDQVQKDVRRSDEYDSTRRHPWLRLRMRSWSTAPVCRLRKCWNALSGVGPAKLVLTCCSGRLGCNVNDEFLSAHPLLGHGAAVSDLAVHESRSAKDRPGVHKHNKGIVYYNHINWLDPVIICGHLQRYGVPLAKVEISRWPLVGQTLRWYHVIYITRGAVDREALKAAWQVLADGDISVIISPEGLSSQDGHLQEAKEGLAFIAGMSLRLG